MRTTVIATAIASLALIAPSAPASAATTDDAAQARAGKSIAGKWKGAVYGDNGGPAGYTAKVVIKKKGKKFTGKVNYPGFCKGKWAYKGKSGKWFKFTEKITTGTQCVSPVKVKVKLANGKLKVQWTEPQSGDRATMKAKRM